MRIEILPLRKESGPLTGREVLARKLDRAMRKVSILVSIIALLMMGFGFADLVLVNPHVLLPGPSVVPIENLVRLQFSSTGLACMSGGIIMLSLLPIFRVVLAMYFYLRSRDMFDSAVSFAVFLELLVSTRLSN